MIAWLSLALASVTSATHQGRVAEGSISWVSTYHGPGQICVPVRTTDQTTGKLSGGMSCGYSSVEVRREQPEGPLDPPLGTPGIHRLMLSGGGFEPEGMVKTAGGWTALDVSRADRARFDSRIRRHGPRKLRPALYVRGPRYEPIEGQMVADGPEPWKRWGILAGLLVVVVLGGIGYRALGRLARAERVATWGSDPRVRQELERDGIV